MSSEVSIYRHFGEQSQFAIVCAHEPFGSEPRRVFGRMCIRAGDKVLGDFDEPACMLNVTASHLQAILEHLPKMDCAIFLDQSDAYAWDLIDKALYLDDDRSIEEVVPDSKRFYQYDFLTNGGESFDKSKSFIVRDGGSVRLLFKTGDDALESMRVEVGTFCAVVRAFLDWIDKGGN
ncbi:hypothetical protein GTP55_20080 [Duganella sp. FT109W]|uniref:Uncharacterized protein n=1 Tax=Duganella margarita TaxID=2692170 RepID=A0ABW9WL35_9BURK|nr:hypothetical protein [Duganella margarita]MYN41663.1 hypothetical protein [Duganella margarita]